MLLNKNALAFYLTLVSSAANSAIITFNFGGVIGSHSGLTSDLQTFIPIGQTFTGSYTFDTSFGATSSNGTNDLSYSGAISNFTTNFGAYYATLDNGGLRYINNETLIPTPPQTGPTIVDSYIVGGDTGNSLLPTNVNTNIILSNYVSGSVNSSYQLRTMRLSAYDYTANMLNSALLTSTPPDIAGLNMRFLLDYQLNCCTGRTSVYGTINSLTVSTVPVPPAIWLFITGLISLISIKYRKSR